MSLDLRARLDAAEAELHAAIKSERATHTRQTRENRLAKKLAMEDYEDRRAEYESTVTW